MLFELPNKCYRVAAKAIIFNEEGKILLVRERGETWDLPGGGIEHEDRGPLETLRREIDEELGVGISSINERPLFVWKLIHNKSGKAILMQVGYGVELLSHDFAKTPDIDEWRFCNADEIRDLRFDASDMGAYLIGFLKTNK